MDSRDMPHAGTTPYLITLAVMVTLTIGGIVWVFSLGGTEATARVGIIAAITTPIIAMLVVVVQTKALQAQVIAQHVATQEAVAQAARVTTAEVAAVDSKLTIVAEQTDGKLNALMAATRGQASAEGQIIGAATARATAAEELQGRATAASLLVTQVPAVPTEVVVANPSVPVHVTEEDSEQLADKVAEKLTTEGQP